MTVATELKTLVSQVTKMEKANARLEKQVEKLTARL